MAILIQVLVAGIASGSVYALIAYGITLVWSISRTLNFAHGDIVITGVFVSLVALFMGMHPAVALVLSILAAAALGAALNKAVFYPLRERSGSTAWLLGVVIFAAILRSLGTLLFGSRSYPRPFSIGAETPISLPWGAVLPSSNYIWIVVIALLTALCLDRVMSRTRFGRSVRAISHSREVAELMGVNTERVMTVTFSLAAAAGALAGLLVAPLTFVGVSLGWVLTLKGFTAAVLGGLGKARGAIVGGLVLGLGEQILASGEFLLPPSAARWFAAGYRDAAVFLLLIAVLMVRPRGLFGVKAARFGD